MATTAYQSSYTGAQIDAAIGAVANKQDTLVSGTNIKTLNNTSLLGSGNISITGAPAIIEMRAINNSGNLENLSFVDAGEAYDIVVANGDNVVVRIDVGYIEDNEPTYYGEYTYMILCSYYHGEGEYYLGFSYSDNLSLRSLYLSNDFEGGTDTLVIQGYDTNGFPDEIEIDENINATTQPFQYTFLNRYDAYYSYIGRNGNVKFVVKRGTRNAQNLFVPNGDTYPLEITYTGETDDKIVCSTYSSEKKLTFVFGIDSTNNQLTIDAINTETIPTESTVSGWGFTKNAGTITGINMNGASKGTSGVVDLGTVITSHQDISGKADKSEMSVVAGTGTDADKTTITLKSGTSATVLTTHQDISGKADTSALAGYLPLTGGTLTGALTVSGDITTTGEITLNNGKYIKAKDSGGTVRNLIEISNSDNLVLGYGMATVGQVNVYATSFMVRTNGVNPSDTALLIDSSHNSEFSGYIKATGDIYMAPSTSTTNTDSKKIYFRTSNFGDTTYNVGPYVQAITHSSTYGRKRLSVFQVNAASYTGTYSEVFTILPNGNVGIGTTSPSTKLGVSGDVDITGSLSFNGTAVATVYSGSSAPSSGTGSDGDIYIQTS